MLNIHNLEQRWLKYKIKSYIPVFTLGLGSIIALIVFFVFFKTSILPTEEKKTEVVAIKEEVINKKIIPEKVKKIQIKEEVITTEYVAPAPIIVKPQSKEKTLVLKPSLSFMNNIEDNISPYMEDEYVNQESIYTPEIKEEKKKRKEKVEVEDIIQEKKKPQLTITKKHDSKDLKDVIKRFKQNKSPALSLFIAKRYYEEKNYQKSYNYALITNELDKNIDESWIIFAKSLVKLEQHELAINTLKTYLKNTKSTSAEVLLRKIESGGFR